MEHLDTKVRCITGVDFFFLSILLYDRHLGENVLLPLDGFCDVGQYEET